MPKRATLWFVVAAALAMPATASAVLSQSDYKNTSKFCTALKSDMGATLFKQTYGTNSNHSNAHGKCVSKNVRSIDQVHASAVTDCKAERAADPSAFALKYGSGKNHKNAYGKCVSATAKAKTADKQDSIVNAARQCRDERKSIGADQFRTKYGTAHNGRNAFGRCVSKLAHGGATRG